MSSVMEQNKLEFTYTESDYLAATRALFLNSQSIIGRLIVTTILVLISGVLMSILIGDFWIWGIIALVLLFEVAIFYNFLIRIPRQLFRGDAKFRDRFEVTYSEEGLAVKTKQIDSKLAWSLYTKVIESPTFYLLVYGHELRMMTLLPKRAFRSQQQQSAFRELINRKISTHSFLGSKKAEAQIEREYQPPASPPDWR
jgi:YcxB-like protein